MILDIFESIVRNSKWISLWKQEYVHVQHANKKVTSSDSFSYVKMTPCKVFLKWEFPFLLFLFFIAFNDNYHEWHCQKWTLWHIVKNLMMGGAP